MGGADGLSCCGAEHGAGHAFCQTDPTYKCCSGRDWAITCPGASDCKVDNTTGIPGCEWHGAELEASTQDVCPGVGRECKTLGADGLACCGAEHGAGFAFCQTDPDYLCCSGDKWAISCSSKAGCSVDDQGVPACKKSVELEAQDVCPGVGQECKTLGADGLACCGAEHGPGFAFCQTDPDYLCCSGDKWAISCSSTAGCSVDDQGIPACKKTDAIAV